MLTETANGDSRRLFWLRVREFAVPPSMIETATVRRRAGDWAGACAAANVDVDLNLRSVASVHGRDLAAVLKDDLRHLVPDLLRWHMPRIAPDGLLRPGLTIALARYGPQTSHGQHPVCLVARTPPAWADAGQRISLAVWAGPRHEPGATGRRYPHPHPDRRFRLDLHRHLWDGRRSGELRIRSGADRPPADTDIHDPSGMRVDDRRCAVDTWAAEAAILLRAEGRSAGAVEVRLGGRRRLVLDPVAGARGLGPVLAEAPADAGGPALPVLPDAATWVPPDLELLRAGLIGVDRLHPCVASALAPDHVPAGTPGDDAGGPRVVRCRGATHRIGLVDGVLAALDHDPVEVRREELLAALGGTPLPCLVAIDDAHRRPDCLTGVRERLDHGDVTGALAVVEGLLGPEALLRDGPLRDELEAAASRRVAYGLFRAGLVGPGPRRLPPKTPRPDGRRPHPRQAAFG